MGVLGGFGIDPSMGSLGAVARYRPTRGMRRGYGDDAPTPGVTTSDVRSPTRTDVRSPTRTRTEVRSPTSTSTEVRSPTSTSTEAYTQGNFTLTATGGAGAGATHVTVNLPGFLPQAPKLPSERVQLSTPPPNGVFDHISDPRPRNTGIFDHISDPPPAGDVSPTVKFIALTLGFLSTAGLAYHGYKRNDSIGWSIVWALFGGAVPIVGWPVAIAQGFGEPRALSHTPNRRRRRR